MPIMDGIKASAEIKQMVATGVLKKRPYICAITASTTETLKKEDKT